MTKTRSEVEKMAEERADMCRRVRNLIVEQLVLDIDPDVIMDDQPLFGRGLELDSIDALDLVVGIDAEFDVSISDDDVGVFSSVNKIVDYIIEKKECE